MIAIPRGSGTNANLYSIDSSSAWKQILKPYFYVSLLSIHFQISGNEHIRNMMDAMDEDDLLWWACGEPRTQKVGDPCTVWCCKGPNCLGACRKAEWATPLAWMQTAKRYTRIPFIYSTSNRLTHRRSARCIAFRTDKHELHTFPRCAKL